MIDSTSGSTTVGNRLCGYFLFGDHFNLVHQVLTNTDIKVVEKGFCPNPT